jgi:hypothetical protein
VLAVLAVLAVAFQRRQPHLLAVLEERHCS